MINNTVIIVAGGIGSRMESSIPKQFLLLKGKPVLMHTIEKFIAFDASLDIIVTLPENQTQTWANLCEQYNFEHKHTVVVGGHTRFQSVYNALGNVSENCKIIAVHDGVRPLINVETIKKCFDLAQEQGSAVPILQINESIRRIDENASEPVNRDGIYIVQTPQIFQKNIIMQAYNQTYVPEFTDDASVVEKSGIKVKFIAGHRENIKITFPDDIVFAEKFL